MAESAETEAPSLASQTNAPEVDPAESLQDQISALEAQVAAEAGAKGMSESPVVPSGKAADLK